MARPAKPESESKKRSSASVPSGNKRPPSAYNLFMKAELPKYKTAHPDVSHRDAFKQVAENWKSHPSNPKNTAAAA